jgi:predicted amidohydrolase
VPPHEWQRADHCRAPARNDFTRREREAGLSIVCVPAITDAQELEWDAYDRGGERFFRTRLSESSRMRDHVRRLLDDLDLSGAMIALLPELALDTALLNEWKEAVLDGAYPPSESQLKWIVAGTGDVSGGDRPVNRCVVLDRITGEEVLTQDKIFPFVLTNAQLDEWKLADLLGEADIEEDIDPGQRIAVLESRLGRVVVLICEDLARLVDLGSALRAHGISHVFSPVFSNETKPHHWEHVKAKEYVNEVGALVVVANSLVVSKRMTPAGPWGTALVHSPATTQLRATENWNDRATFQIVAGDPVPLHGDYSFAREDDDYFDAHE